MATDDRLDGVPLLVLANKQDSEGGLCLARKATMGCHRLVTPSLTLSY